MGNVDDGGDDDDADDEIEADSKEAEATPLFDGISFSPFGGAGGAVVGGSGR